jgi:hypothetical protein
MRRSGGSIAIITDGSRASRQPQRLHQLDRYSSGTIAAAFSELEVVLACQPAKIAHGVSGTARKRESESVNIVAQLVAR